MHIIILVLLLKRYSMSLLPFATKLRKRVVRSGLSFQIVNAKRYRAKSRGVEM